jgi:hypothetical protein
MSYNSALYRVYHWLASIPPRVQFRNKDPLTPEEKQALIDKFAKGYYIILTGNNYHLSSVAVKAMSFVKTGKYSRYSHALMNCDNLVSPEDVDKFKFMEATVSGVHYSTFEQVFDCDTVCVLSPRNMTNEGWTEIIDGLIQQKGKPYDDLFRLSEESHVSCVELVRNALMKYPAYEDAFGNFEDMISREGNLLPQMFRECQDFEVVYENK